MSPSKHHKTNKEVKKLKKLFVITVVVLSFALLFTGCTSTAPEPVTPPVEQQNGDQTAPSATPDQPAAKVAAEAQDAQGKLNGWIDNNSVEIEMSPEDVLAFRVTDVLEQMKGIEDGATVKFSYIQNEHGQMVITKIEKAQ